MISFIEKMNPEGGVSQEDVEKRVLAGSLWLFRVVNCRRVRGSTKTRSVEFHCNMVGSLLDITHS